MNDAPDPEIPSLGHLTGPVPAALRAGGRLSWPLECRKSSLLNALVGSKQAHVSSTPGRTQAINFFALLDSAASMQPALVLADLPGYGYAKVSKSISAEWPKFIEPYLAMRPTLALCVCLVDSKIPPQESDLKLIHYLKEIEQTLMSWWQLRRTVSPVTSARSRLRR